MWGWGGGGPPPPTGAAGGGGKDKDEEDDELTPPLEIGLDEDEADLGTSLTSMSDDPELRDLQAQFSMQEDLLGQLKGVLRSNEAKLHFKEREVEVRFKSGMPNNITDYA